MTSVASLFRLLLLSFRAHKHSNMPSRKRARGAATAAEQGDGPFVTIAGDDKCSKFEGLAQLWRERALVDCEITVAGRKFVAHRVVLAASSAYMKAAFVGGMAESSGDITLDDMDSECFAAVLTWMYEGTTSLAEALLPDLLQVAARLHVPLLVAEAERLVIARVTPANAVGAWILADMHTLPDLFAAAKKTIVGAFDAAAAGPDFVQMRAPWLEEVLASDELHVEREADVFEALKGWHDAQRPAPDQEVVARLLRCVRWECMDQAYLQAHVNTDPLIKTSAENAMIVAAAFQTAFHGTPARRRLGTAVECSFQSAFDTNGVLYHIATAGGTRAYQNPHDAGHVVAARYPITGGDSTDAKFVQHEHQNQVYNYLNDDVGSWMSVDLGEDRSLQPNYYCLRSDGLGESHKPRNWRLEGSNNGQEWSCLKEHNGDTALREEPMSTAAWPLNNVQDSFRHFRILLTGRNSTGCNYLMCAGIELYGRFRGRCPP